MQKKKVLEVKYTSKSERKKVNWSEKPYSSIGRIIAHHKNGKGEYVTSHGTGFLIAQRIVLTAKHVL